MDEAILRAFAGWRISWLNRLMMDITSLGSMTVAVLITIVTCILLWRLAHDRQGVARIILVVGAGQIWVQIFKRLFAVARPSAVPHLVEFSGFTFPSGHAFMSAALYGVLAAVVCRHIGNAGARRAVRVSCYAMVGLIALSRVYLGVHYPSDVVAGVVLGAAWVAATGILVRRG